MAEFVQCTVCGSMMTVARSACLVCGHPRNPPDGGVREPRRPLPSPPPIASQEPVPACP